MGFLGSYVKQKIKQNVINTLSEATDGTSDKVLKLNKQRKIYSANKTYMVQLNFVPEHAEQDVIQIITQMFGVDENEVYDLLEQSPAIVSQQLSKTDAKLLTKQLKHVGADVSMRG